MKRKNRKTFKNEFFSLVYVFFDICSYFVIRDKNKCNKSKITKIFRLANALSCSISIEHIILLIKYLFLEKLFFYLIFDLFTLFINLFKISTH